VHHRENHIEPLAAAAAIETHQSRIRRVCGHHHPLPAFNTSGSIFWHQPRPAVPFLGDPNGTGSYLSDPSPESPLPPTQANFMLADALRTTLPPSPLLVCSHADYFSRKRCNAEAQTQIMFPELENLASLENSSCRCDAAARADKKRPLLRKLQQLNI